MIDNPKDLAFLALKAALACLLAMLLDRWVGNPDSVSSTFVAVLCITPITLIGLQSAWSQLVASALGGIWGATALALGLPALAGVPLGVGLAIVTCYLARVTAAYPVAAFTALYLVLVPRETPFDTLRVRLLAVAVGAIAGFLVNVTISALFYRRILEERVARAERNVLAVLPAAGRQGAAVGEPAFARLTHLQGELASARQELRWRRDTRGLETLDRLTARVEHLRYLLHLVCHLSYGLREHGADEETIAPLIAWLDEPTADPPSVAGALAVTVCRIGNTARALHAPPGTVVARL